MRNRFVAKAETSSMAIGFSVVQNCKRWMEMQEAPGAWLFLKTAASRDISGRHRGPGKIVS